MNTIIFGGGSSFTGANVLKYNLKCANGAGSGWYSLDGDVGSPFWYPFKLFNPSTKNEVNFLEQAYIQEPSPEMMEKLFQKSIYGINKNIFTISLHPAHSQTDTFMKGGQLQTFKDIISMKEEYNLKFKTLKNVYKEIGNA